MSSRLLHLIYSMAGSWWRALAWRLPAMVWRGSAKLWGPMATCLADVVNGGAWGAVIALPLARLRSLLPWLQKMAQAGFSIDVPDIQHDPHQSGLTYQPRFTPAPILQILNFKQGI